MALHGFPPRSHSQRSNFSPLFELEDVFALLVQKISGLVCNHL